MKTTLTILLLLAFFGAGGVYADIQVRLNAYHQGDLENILEPDAWEPSFNGIGWEIVRGSMGLGGVYLVSFHQDSQDRWYCDWNGEALYVSYHLFGPAGLFQPFVQAGLGSAGSVCPDRLDAGEAGGLRLSIFPVFSAGLAFYLDGLLIGMKTSWIPDVMEIPFTDFGSYDVAREEFSFFIGMALGGGDDDCPCEE